MDIEMFREYCLTLPGTTEGMKWGENLCFMIEEKIYAITSLDDGGLSFKINPEDFEELAARDGIAQAAHWAKKHWVTIDALDVLSDRELRECIAASRALVINKLPKKTQALYI